MKRVRSSDTAAGMAQAFIDAAKGLAEPPKHIELRAEDRPYWQAIVALKAKDEWTEVHLVAAAQLARTQADIEAWTERFQREEPIIHTGPHDTPRPNPLLSMIETATRRQLALMRSLGLAAMDDPRDLKKKQQTLKAARQVAKATEAESLLA